MVINYYAYNQMCKLDTNSYKLLHGILITYAVIPACRSVAYAHKLPGTNTHPLHLPMFQHRFLFLQRARENYNL